MFTFVLPRLFVLMAVYHVVVEPNTPTTDPTANTDTTNTATTNTDTTNTATTNTDTTNTATTNTDTTNTATTNTDTTNTATTGTETSAASTESPAASTESSIASKSSTSTTTTSTSTTTTTAAPQPNNRICPGNSGMVDATRVRAKSAHNYRRSRLARGLVANKAGRNLPTATNIMALEYDCKLEESAIRSAQRCSRNRDPTLSPNVQENTRLFSKSQASSVEDALIFAIQRWWRQIRWTGGIGQRVTYTQYNAGSSVEWFTRMAWATTRSIGCAVTTCHTNNWSVVCHYSPGGNMLNQQIYRTGPTCSNCPANPSTFCNENGLCQLASTFA